MFANSNEKMDSLSTNLLEKMNSLSVTISEKMDRFPTKVQLSLWACAGLTALLGVTASMIAVLLRLSGHDDVAAVIDAVSGK
jgi:hypothetical protein